MARTVIPPSAISARGEGGAEGDGLPEKIVKYVPAETLAFFVPVAAALGTNHDGVLIAALVVGAVGTAGYLWYAGRKLEEKERPLPHFYVLAVIAFACWAVATSANTADLLGIDRTVADVILPFAVFLVPIADGVLNELLVKRA